MRANRQTDRLIAILRICTGGELKMVTADSPTGDVSRFSYRPITSTLRQQLQQHSKAVVLCAVILLLAY